MTWSILFSLILVLGVAILGLLHRRAGMHALRSTLAERESARGSGSADAQLQYPAVDLTRCVGCGACVRACPEDGVLGLVHGQAAVIHGARCVGHGLCAEVCPVEAIAVTLGDLSTRDDIPVLSDRLEADGIPGLFLAGEVTGYALVRTAINHGRTVAARVIERLAAEGVASGVRAEAVGIQPRRRQAAAANRPPPRSVAPGTGSRAAIAVAAEPPRPLDLIVVGSGPAGLSCALAAKESGLNFLVLERDSIGGTVAKYPRRKLVMTQPVELPLYGTLQKTSYVKEELIRIWEDVAETCDLPIRTGEEFTGLETEPDGTFTVRTKTGAFRTRNVSLCLGRRGTPRKLGVPGEELPKVVYSLIDAESYQGRHVLVVGGGDSAIEAAVGLAEQPGNRVTLSYRKSGFFRVKARNQANIEERVAAGAIQLVLDSEVESIEADRVTLSIADAESPHGRRRDEIVNDDVFIFAGGVPPFGLLEASGVSFDGSKRPPAVTDGERGTGILTALVWGLALTLATLIWCACFRSYYAAEWSQRIDSRWNALLAPTGAVGLSMGVAATLLILLNLGYVARRSRLGHLVMGSMQNWLSIHVVTGILALLFLLVHGGMVVRNTTGGLAFLAVVVLVITGGIGRYLYAHLPKAANGRNLEHAEARDALQSTLAEWDQGGRGIGPAVRTHLDALLDQDPWGGTFVSRVRGLLTAKTQLRGRLARIETAATAEGVAPDKIHELLGMARELHRAGVMAMHYEELRGLVGSWRLLHRWLAVAMVLLAANHIAIAIRYARLW